MNDAAVVCGGESVSDLQTDQQCSFQFERTTGNELAHVLAFNELHRDEVNTVNFVEIVNGADVWMVQRRRELCFSFKSFEIGFFRAEFRRDDFDYNRAIEFCIRGFVNRALPAHTELVGDAKVAERFAYHFLGHGLLGIKRIC